MELKNIIREEIQSFNERQPVFRFTNIVEKPSFFNFQTHSSDYDVDIIESNISITWRAIFRLNDEAIENFKIEIESVQGTYKVDLYDKQSDELQQENQRDINEVKWTFQIYDAPLQKNVPLYVRDISFDFETKICTVDFNTTQVNV